MNPISLRSDCVRRLLMTNAVSIAPGFNPCADANGAAHSKVPGGRVTNMGDADEGANNGADDDGFDDDDTSIGAGFEAGGACEEGACSDTADGGCGCVSARISGAPSRSA